MSATTTTVGKHKVTLAPPVLVGRSKGYLWFPTLAKTPDGDLLATMTDYADETVDNATAKCAWSSDGGQTWGPLINSFYCDVKVQLASGDLVLLPYYLFPDGLGMKAAYKRVPAGAREQKTEEGLTVSGWPKPDHRPSPNLKVTGFVFNGQSVPLKDGAHIATLYGTYEGDKRYSLMTAVSRDGVAWKIHSTIAGPECTLEGAEGPCEAAMCRLKDGRLMCVFRLAGHVPFGQSWSSDEGLTWTKPVAMQPFSVQPSLATLPDGTVVLSGGRDGLYLWLNEDGSGRDWLSVDIKAHHNAHCRNDLIGAGNHTSAYTEVVVLDDKHLLYIYDRLPFSWGPVPADSTETNSVWVVRVTLE